MHSYAADLLISLSLLNLYIMRQLLQLIDPQSVPLTTKVIARRGSVVCEEPRSLFDNHFMVYICLSLILVNKSDWVCEFGPDHVLAKPVLHLMLQIGFDFFFRKFGNFVVFFTAGLFGNRFNTRPSALLRKGLKIYVRHTC